MRLKNILIPLICLCTVCVAYSQNLASGVVRSAVKEAAKKSMAKEGVKLSSEKMAKMGIKKGAENSAEKALGKRLASRVIREKLVRTIAQKGFRNLYTYANRQAAKSLNRVGMSAITKSVKDGRFSGYLGRLVRNSTKFAAKKETKKGISHLVTLYCGKGGFKKFMSLSIKDRMVTVKQITKYIFSLSQTERNSVLMSMSEEMRIKVLKMRKLMTTRMPGKTSPKGLWTGERGNSDFILNDNYIWKDPKTGIKMRVGDLKKKYNIKGEIRVKYRDGEPIFDKSNSLGTTTVEYKPNYNYKDLKDLHNPVNENLSKESWVKTIVR